MSKKITLELSHAELHGLLKLIPRSKQSQKIREKLLSHFIESVQPAQLLSVAAIMDGSDPVIDLVVHTLSILTGYPESVIPPDRKLSSLGMTDSKITQLTGYLNQYITSVHGASVNPGEITAGNTVQDVVDLIQSKTL